MSFVTQAAHVCACAGFCAKACLKSQDVHMNMQTGAGILMLEMHQHCDVFFSIKNPVTFHTLQVQMAIEPDNHWKFPLKHHPGK